MLAASNILHFGEVISFFGLKRLNSEQNVVDRKGEVDWVL